MRMNPPRGMGGMGPQVGYNKRKGHGSHIEQNIDVIRASYNMERYPSALYYQSTVKLLPQSNIWCSNCQFMSKPNVWLPFIKGFHKNSYNVKPAAYKQYADNSPPLLKRNFGLAGPITLPLNVRGALIISLALTRAHPPLTSFLHVKYCLRTPTSRDKQRRNTHAAMSKSPPTHFPKNGARVGSMPFITLVLVNVIYCST